MYVPGGLVWTGIVLFASIPYIFSYTFIGMENLELGKKIIGLVPLNFFLDRSLIYCLGECMSRQHCRVMSYHRMTTMCLLFDKTPNDLEVDHDSSFVTTTHIQQWPEEIIHPCRRDTCPPWNQCVVHKNGTTCCVISECQGDVADDSVVHHSVVHRGAGTGYATFSCRDNRTLIGPAYRVCGLDGEWSTPNYRCAFIPEVTMENNSYVIPTGRNVSIMCNVTALPDVYNVYWNFRESAGTSKHLLNTEEERFQGGTVDESSLTIVEATTADTGFYTCNAENQEGLGSGEEIYLVVTGVKPTISINQKRTYRTLMNSTITIRITVTSDSALANVSWLFRSLENGQRSTVTIDNYYFSGANLTHPSLTVYIRSGWVSGHYKCIVENAAGRTHGRVQSLRIRKLGPLVQNGTHVSTNVGSNVTLLCSVSPTPEKVRWLASGEHSLPHSIDWTSGRYSGSTILQPSLTITQIRFSDRGWYWCTAKDRNGNRAMGYSILLHVDQ